MRNHNTIKNKTGVPFVFAVAIAIVLAVGILLVPGTTNGSHVELGDSFTVNGISYTVTSDSPSEVSVSYNGFGVTNAVIPSTVTSGNTTFAVTTIDNRAFRSESNLLSVIIPDSVTKISWSAFESCTALRYVSIGSGVTTIEDGAFFYCSSLKTIEVDPLNTSFKTVDGVLYNASMTELIQYPAQKTGSSYTVPQSVNKICAGAFALCELATVSIPASVETIGDSAFTDCANLNSITMESGLKTIGGGAFFNCSSLTSVYIPSTVNDIQPEVFSGCSSLIEINVSGDNSSYASSDGILFSKDMTTLLAYPENSPMTSYTTPLGVKTLGEYSFKNCARLTSVVLTGVTAIESEAFEGCSGLSSVSLPQGLSKIGWAAFKDCTSLVSVSIPASVSYIDYYVFSGCTSLTNISVDASNTYYASVDNVLFSKDMKTLIRCPEGKAGPAYAIPNTVETIMDSAFLGCKNFNSIAMPSGVKKINAGAFIGCTELTAMSLPSTIESIDGDVFSGCSNLSTINVDPSNSYYASNGGVLFTKDMKTLLKYPMAKTDLTYSIPVGVTTINYVAFSDNTHLTGVVIPGSVNMINASAFNGCSSITTMSIPANVTTLDTSAFSGCTSLSAVNVDVNNTVFFSNGGVLYDKTMSVLLYYPLAKTGASFSIPNGVQLIGSRAFYNCSQLKTIITPSSITSFGSDVFYGCSIESFDVGSDAMVGMFAGSNSLKTVNVGDTVISIGDYAFSDCNQLTHVIIGTTVGYIGEGAFDGCSNLLAIDVNASNTYYSSLNSILFSKDQGVLLKYPSSKDYASYTVPSTVLKIGRSAFAECPNLTAISIPSSVTTIERNSIDCGNLSSLVFGSGLTTVDTDAFGSMVLYDANGSSVITVSANALKDQEFHAYGGKLIKNSIVTVSSNDPAIGTVTGGGSYQYGSSVSVATSSVTGHHFYQWSNGATTPSLKFNANGDISLQATFYANSYWVRYKPNGGSGLMSDERFVYGVPGNLIVNGFARTGFSFTEWNTAADGSGTNYSNAASVINLSDEDEGQITLYAQWQVNSYTLTYKLDGEIYGDIENYVYGTTVTVRDKAVKTGYTVSEWSNSGTFSMPAVNVTIVASSTANRYTIVFSANGGTGTVIGEIFTYDVAKVLPNNAFIRAGYVFSGWNTAADGSGIGYADGASVLNITALADVTVTLYAQWSGIKYEVKFDANGGNGNMANESFTYGTSQALTANVFVYNNHSFIGWATTTTGAIAYQDGATVSNLIETADSTVTLYAKWAYSAEPVINSEDRSVDIVDTADTESVKLTQSNIDSVKEALSGSSPAADTLRIGSSTWNANFSASAFKGVAGNENSDISISAKVLSAADIALVPGLADASAGKTVYRFTLMVGTVAYTDNFAGTVTMKVKYTPTVGENTSKLTVWYYDETTRGLMGAVNAKYVIENGIGYAVFEMKHFSYWTIGESSAKPPVNDDNTILYFGIGAVAVIVLAGAALFVIKRKH
jgi:uncharacterized repeat protein (TIGR02543 family)